MLSLNPLIKEASGFCSSEFNLEIKKSKLKIYSEENWKEFCRVNNFVVGNEGLYVPLSYSAYVNVSSDVLVSNVFHEFFGHGLFCEHSQIGKNLVDIIKNRGNEKSFLYDEVNTKEQPLGFCKTNIGNYEGFALWLEDLLCKETSNKKIWDLKKSRLPDDYVSLLEYFKSKEQELTRFGFMSQLGFPKFYDNEKIIEILKHFYSGQFNNIGFIILYGSRKPESDIDLFVVSTNPSQNHFNGWLDIYGLNREEFQGLIRKLDISITDPLFTGTLIYGDEIYFKQIKQNILEQEITQEAINYSLLKAEEQRRYLPCFEDMPREKKACLSYIFSCIRNAEELSRGNKLLTLEGIRNRFCLLS